MYNDKFLNIPAVGIELDDVAAAADSCGLRGDREHRGSGDIALSHQDDGGATDSVAVLHDAHALRGFTSTTTQIIN
jgi:hypothetical protein